MSDTPRTDRWIKNCNGWHHVSVERARELERELAEANERIKRLEAALDQIEEAMKRPASNHRFMQIAGPARQAINISRKSKESK